MDVGINFALNLINFNAKTSFDGKFDPPQNSIHLAGDQNFYQYSPLLYGNSDGDWREGPCQNCNVIEHGSDEMQDSHNLDHHDSKRFKVCGKCSKDQRTPNEEQQKQLDVIIEQIRSTPNTVPQNYLYDRQLLSANPEDYCKLDIFTFFPNRMVKHMGLPEVKCWNGVNCKVPLTSKRTKKDNVVSEVVEKSYIIRYFEGMDSNGWIVGPKFYCKRCEQFRSVFDDPVNTLLPMGVPAVLLRRCGFVSFKDSIISREVYEYIMTHMTSPCGAENIATHFSKLRSLRYIEDARVCLEMQLLKFQQTKSASTLSGYGFSSSTNEFKSFPSTDSHCGGLGRVMLGISAIQIQRIFVSCSEQHKTLADRIMAGIGGQAMKSDGNYSAPKRMKMKINGSERMSPTSLQGVVNEVNQVMSYQLTGLAEAHEEREQQLREIHERYLLNGGLIEDGETIKNSPMALEDKCCNVLELYATAGWKNIPIKGDEFHYTDRLVTEVKISQHDEGLLAKKNEFRQALKKCFSDKNDQPGVYIDPDTILQNMSEVKELFMQEEAGRIWNKEVEAAYQNLIPHIKNCLALPDHIKPIVYDRNGNYVLKRGTNAAEALWRVLLRYLPDNCSVMLGDTVIKLLCSEINVKRYVQYDSRFPFMEIPFLAFGDLILFTAMSEKMGVPCCFPKIRIIDRDYKNVFFGWDAATHFVSGQQQKLRHNVKPVKSIDIPMEADQYLLDEIMVATASSKTHLYVLNTLEDEMQNSIHSSFPSSGCASACSTSNHEIIEFTSPQPTRLTSKRKNKPAGSLSDSGKVIEKSKKIVKGSQTSSHKRSSYQDILSAKSLMNAYPSSYEWHRMHGDIDLFTRQVTPIERQLLKHLMLSLTSCDNLADVRLSSKEHKAPLHKMWDIRCDLVDMTENLILKQFKNIIRRRGDTDLFKLALRLIAVQQVHSLQHKQLYEKPIRDKLGAVKTMALTTSKIEELHQQLLTQSQDDFQAYCDTTNSSEDFISAEETTEIDRETAKCGRNNDCHRDYTEHLNDLAGYAEVNDIIQSDSEVSTNEEVEPAARMSQLQQYSGGDIYYCPPKNLTDEEIRLYLDNLDSCIIQRSNSTVIEHSWTSLAAIFNKHAQYPEQFIKRTIWPRTYDRLRNRYFNDGLHKKRKLDDSSSCIINCSDSNSMIISSCGNMNSSLSESDNFNFNSTSNDMQTTAAIDNEEPPSNMLSISTVKSGPLEEEELIWLRAKGKQLKEEGVENITGIMLSVAYLKQFKIYKRNGTDLATAWQKYFKNQKDTPSAWYRTFSQNRSMRKQCVSNDKTI